MRMNASRMLSMYGSKAISKSARMHRLGATIWSAEVRFGILCTDAAVHRFGKHRRIPTVAFFWMSMADMRDQLV